MFFFRRRKRTKKSLGHLRLCPRPRNALKVEKERDVGLSRDNRGGFLRCVRVKTLTSVEMTLGSDTIQAFPLGGRWHECERKRTE